MIVLLCHCSLGFYCFESILECRRRHFFSVVLFACFSHYHIIDTTNDKYRHRYHRAPPLPFLVYTTQTIKTIKMRNGYRSVYFRVYRLYQFNLKKITDSDRF